jgi:hypothetical protein
LPEERKFLTEKTRMHATEQCMDGEQDMKLGKDQNQKSKTKKGHPG